MLFSSSLSCASCILTSSSSSSLSITMTSVRLERLEVFLLLFVAKNQFAGARTLSFCKTKGLKVRSKSDCSLDGPATTSVGNDCEEALGLVRNFAIMNCDLFCASLSFFSRSARANFFSRRSFSW